MQEADDSGDLLLLRCDDTHESRMTSCRTLGAADRHSICLGQCSHYAYVGFFSAFELLLLGFGPGRMNLLGAWAQRLDGGIYHRGLVTMGVVGF